MTGWPQRVYKPRNIAAALATLVGIYGGLAFFGIDLPRPAWSGELKKVESQVVNLGIQVSERELEDTNLRYYMNRREQKWYSNEGTRIPDFLLEEQATLETKRSRLESQLEKLRKRAANGK